MLINTRCHAPTTPGVQPPPAGKIPLMASWECEGDAEDHVRGADVSAALH